MWTRNLKSSEEHSGGCISNTKKVSGERLGVGECLENVAFASLLGVPRFAGLDDEGFLSHQLH